MEQEAPKKIGRPKGINTPYKTICVNAPLPLYQRFFKMSHLSKCNSDRAFLEKLLDVYEARNKEQ